jgi:peptidyl-prolyl cis-trans isomerase C
VAGAFVLCYAAGGAVGQTQPAGGGGKPAAIVNGEVIPMSELEEVLKQEGPMPVAMPESLRKQQRQIALDALINEALLRQFLKQNVPPIDAKELTARMADLVAGLKQQNKTLADFCRERNQSEEQIKANLAATLQWIQYARQHITDQDVERYYKENKDLFDKVLVRASEITLLVSPQGGQADRERAKTQLAQLREKILAKQIDFAQAAKQTSQGPTRDLGGDLDWFPHVRGILPESVLQAAFTLPPEQVSDVIDSEMGVHLIKVTGRRPGEPSDFAKIKEEVRQLCIEEMQQIVLQQLRKDAKITVNVP